VLPAEAAAVLADEASPAFLAGGATITRGWFAGIDRLAGAIRTGAGIPWHEQDPADGFDLICLLDTLHDLGDPAAALAYARKALAPDGAVLVVEPNAADDYAANLASPLAALNYAASTFQCTPAALAQPGGVALGAQAGPAAVRQLADDAGFSRFRQVTQTPVNVVLELRR
jgi:SAM-dependent methyltransferase